MKAMTSNYLTQHKGVIKELVNKLLKHFEFVSVLGVDTKGKKFGVNRGGVSIEDSMWTERGFVVRVYQDKTYSEYAFNMISKDNLDALVNDIIIKTTISESIKNSKYVKLYDYPLIQEEEVVGSFIKNEEQTKEKLQPNVIVEKLLSIRDKAFESSDLLINCVVSFEQVDISKIYISGKKDLEQSYTWGNAMIVPIVRKDNNMKYYYEAFSSVEPLSLLDELENSYQETVKIALKLLDSKRIEPGEYEVICSPDITGVIAHEAFGHGVEMDMFVKNRAKAVEFIGKEVASPLVEMHDGASTTENVSSYAFDDEGTLASDTIIINKGILKTGISDSLSAMRLGTKPTGNGKRQSYDHKAYSRMTNTYFEGGSDKFEDMIKSIEHGYLLKGVQSGMEDPKNWGIQVMAILGIEIKDGKLTENYVSPIMMTGYVPDLLKSITMVSENVEISGSGVCGKGHKEMVKTSDGGPYIKAKVKIG